MLQEPPSQYQDTIRSCHPFQQMNIAVHFVPFMTEISPRAGVASRLAITETAFNTNGDLCHSPLHKTSLLLSLPSLNDMLKLSEESRTIQEQVDIGTVTVVRPSQDCLGKHNALSEDNGSSRLNRNQWTVVAPSTQTKHMCRFD